MLNEALTHYLVVVPNYWGKATSIAGAWRKVREAGGPTKGSSKGQWVLWKVHKDTYCESIHGALTYNREHPPFRLGAGDAVLKHEEERDQATA